MPDNILLTYEPTLEESAEPQIRLYKRTPRSMKVRAKTTYGSCLLVAAIGIAIAPQLPDSFNFSLKLFIIISAVIFAGLADWFSHVPRAIANITACIKSNRDACKTTTTTYFLYPGWLTCDSGTTALVFRLNLLANIREDDSFIELDFMPHGLCTVPKRVFATEADKQQFIARIQQASQSQPIEEGALKV
ncbi:hypothetical protein H5P28_10535 [Ruficoccus amylovorans]|uniref:YcxB-like protein domain-containing protein n=1 Tax=Ruficoccus amylovorans TaxID=1804625 RepID=A0A842HGK9_9BACT|nr:hypothetical protein [Ruficoccus amylovorans]MBC2594697.1 hypothetical protein [Ruficoccus amylovorans]